MATQYTSILKLALPVQGELSGTWGDVVNDNITSMVEEAIAGRAVINTWTANSHTLTTADGTTSESRAAILTLTDTGTALTGAGTVICPAASKIYIVENGTGQTITVKTASGTGIAVPNTKNMVVFCDGTNVEEGITNINSLTLNGDGATVSSIKDEDNMASDSATALATQQSIKAYVDSQVGANNELSEVLANGNTTGGTDISVSSGDDITFADSSKAIFGAGSDLQLYHDGGTSFIDDVGTGNLHIRTDGASIKLRTSANADMIVAENGGAAKLYHAGSQKLATLSTGIDVTGVITTDGMTTSADINFGDNDKAVFGAGSDLQIYHDGSHSYVSDQGTGRLVLNSSGGGVRIEKSPTENMAIFTPDGNCELFYDNSLKLATTSTGIDVTGTVTADGLTVSSSAGSTASIVNISNGVDASPNRQLAISETGGSGFIYKIDSTGASGSFGQLNLATNGTNRINIGSGGDISFYEDTGTTAKLFWDASTERLELSNLKLYSDNVRNEGGILYIGTSGNNATQFYNNDANTVHISGAGNVGIGTSSPESGLHLFDGTNVNAPQNANRKATLTIEAGSEGSADIQMLNASYNHIFFGDAADANVGYFLYDHTDNSMQFATNAAERMRIDSSGNVGIGTSSPQRQLHVSKNANNTHIAIERDGTDNPSALILGANQNKTEIISSAAEESTSGVPLTFLTGNTERMRLDASGNVGIGTSSPTSYSGQTNLNINSAGVSRIDFDISDALQGYALAESGYMSLFANTGKYLMLGANNTEAMRIDASGNLLVGTTTTDGGYDESDGGASTTFMGASIGGAANGSAFVSRRAAPLQLNRQANDGDIAVFRKNGTTVGSIGTFNSVPYFAGQNANAGGFRIDSTGSNGVIIPTTNTGANRDAATDLGYSSGGTNIRFRDLYLSGQTFGGDGAANVPSYAFGNDTNMGMYRAGNNIIGFSTSSAERMRIDGSGNLLVGTTDDVVQTNSGTGNGGIVLRNNNYVAVASDGSAALELNRLASDGEIANFRKDGTTVGSIGSRTGNLFTTYTSNGYGLTGTATSNAVIPSFNGATSDNAVDLGGVAVRFDDIYATNGTIQTSDRNEKQDIEALSDAEQRVAVAAKGLLRKFRWIDAVEAKGDDARIHFGIIAQDLQDAFTAEGLDAGRYAMFISSTWWESTEVIPAVEAQEAVVDEEGNVVEEAVEAQEERTVVHTHDTAEEAPEGSVERTRLGVRYSELLAFIIAAI